MPSKPTNRPWGLWTGSVAVAASCLVIPPAPIATVSQELIALFGLLLAGALPTMILTATILRAGAFSPKRIGEYGAALDAQLSFWFGLFLWAMAACVAVLVGKAAWDAKTPYVLLIPHGITARVPWLASVEITRLANCALGFTGVQVVARLVPMLHGLRSLLRLNSLIATEEAVAKAKEQTASGAVKVRQVQPPPGHGSVVED